MANVEVQELEKKIKSYDLIAIVLPIVNLSLCFVVYAVSPEINLEIPVIWLLPLYKLLIFIFLMEGIIGQVVFLNMRSQAMKKLAELQIQP